jgi:hypothetical protein
MTRPLDCDWELASDPILLRAEHMKARCDDRERRGIRLQSWEILLLDQAVDQAARQRAAILAKYGVSE